MNRKQIVTLGNVAPFENKEFEIDLFHTRITGRAGTGKTALLWALWQRYCDIVIKAGGTDVEIEFADWSILISMDETVRRPPFECSFNTSLPPGEPIADEHYDAIEFFFSRMLIALTEKKYTCFRRKNIANIEEREPLPEEMVIAHQENGEITVTHPFCIYEKNGRLYPRFTPETERELGGKIMMILDAAWTLSTNIDARSYLGYKHENALHLSLMLPHVVFFDEVNILLGESAANALHDNLREYLPALRLFTTHQTRDDRPSIPTYSKEAIMIKNKYVRDPNMTELQTVREAVEIHRVPASVAARSSFLVHPGVTLIDTTNTFVFGEPDSGKSLLLRVIREMLDDLLKEGHASEEAIQFSRWSTPVNVSRISPLSDRLPSFSGSGDVEKDYDAVEFFFGRILMAITDGKHTCCSFENLHQFVTAFVALPFDPPHFYQSKKEMYIVPSLGKDGKPSNQINCLFTVEVVGNGCLIPNFGSGDGPFTNKLRAAWTIAAGVYNPGLHLKVTQFEDILKLPHVVFFDDVDFILEWMAARNLKDNLREHLPNSRLFFSFRNPDWVYNFKEAIKLVTDGIREDGKIRLKGESNTTNYQGR